MTSQDARSPFRQANQGAAAPCRRSAPLRAILLASSALISASLPATVAHAGDATWLANPGSNDFNNKNNWSPATAAPDGIATFGTSVTTAIDFTQTTTLGGMVFNATNYSFNTGANTVSFNGAGITEATGGRITLNVDSGGILQFLSGSTASFARINNASGANIDFSDNSSAGQSIITNSGTFSFNDNSTAQVADIFNSGMVRFFGSSAGGGANFTMKMARSTSPVSRKGSRRSALSRERAVSSSGTRRLSS